MSLSCLHSQTAPAAHTIAQKGVGLDVRNLFLFVNLLVIIISFSSSCESFVLFFAGGMKTAPVAAAQGFLLQASLCDDAQITADMF